MLCVTIPYSIGPGFGGEVLGATAHEVGGG